MVVYGIRSCDTCRRARAWLEARGVDYRFHDVRADGVDAAILKRWVAAVGWEALVNRRSATWRMLPTAERVVREPAEAVALMRARPTVIRRPVLEHGSTVLVGYSQQAWQALIGIGS